MSEQGIMPYSHVFSYEPNNPDRHLAAICTLLYINVIISVVFYQLG